MTLQVLMDRIEIADPLSRYARGMDTRDWKLWKSVFTADAVLDFSSAGLPAASRDEVAAVLERALADMPMAQHLVTNVEVDFAGADRARVRALLFNQMRIPGRTELSRHRFDQVAPGGLTNQRLSSTNRSLFHLSAVRITSRR